MFLFNQLCNKGCINYNKFIKILAQKKIITSLPDYKGMGPYSRSITKFNEWIDGMTLSLLYPLLVHNLLRPTTKKGRHKI